MNYNNIMQTIDSASNQILNAEGISASPVVIILTVFAIYCFASAFGKVAKDGIPVTIMGLMVAVIFFFIGYGGAA